MASDEQHLGQWTSSNHHSYVLVLTSWLRGSVHELRHTPCRQSYLWRAEAAVPMAMDTVKSGDVLLSDSVV